MCMALEHKFSHRGCDKGNEQEVMVPWVMKQKADGDGESSQTLDRYYQLYRRGEFEEDILQAGGIVDSSGCEKDNWWAIAGRGSDPELDSVDFSASGAI